MSRLKQNPNLFLGKQELDRLMKFLDADGFRRFLSEQSSSYGLIKNSITGDFSNGRVQLGTNALTIKVNEIKIVDKNINFLYQPLKDNIAVTNNGSWYWVQATYAESSIEAGTFSIDTQGNLVGDSNSKLLEILRGKPDHASVIKFVGSTNNLLEYEVADVIDNQNAVLAGDFTAETNLQVVVIGTFDPIATDSSHKNIFLYDSLTLALNLETVSNTPPSFTEGVTFNLARVSIQSGQVVIQDKRTEFWETKGSYLLNQVDQVQNPLFGVEAVKWDSLKSTRTKNIVEIGWGFRTTNWSINTSLNTVTVSGGSGGQFEDTTFFATNNFNGWRIYTKEGLYSIIKTSVKSGSQFNLELDTLDPNRFTDTSQELVIVPNVEEIEISCIADPDDSTDLPNEKFLFPINRGLCRIELLVYSEPATYNIKFRYKNHLQYSSWFLPFNTSRYLTEVSFTDLGVLVSSPDRVYQSYTPDAVQGFIILHLAPNAYSSFVNTVFKGDILGIEYISNLETTIVGAPSRKLDFLVGTRKQTVVVTGSSNLAGDARFNFVTTSVKEGATFYLYVKTVFNNNNNQYKVLLYEDNTTVLYTFTQDEINKGEQFFIVKFDGTHWQVTHFDKDYSGDGVYKQGSESVNTVSNIEVVGGKNILLVTGYFERIRLTNAVPGYQLDGVRFLNNKFINNLKINVEGAQSVILNSGTQPASTGTETYFGFSIGGTTLDRTIITSADTFIFSLGASGNQLLYSKIFPASSTIVGTVPVGAILPYWGTTAPTGFWMCDGSTITDPDSVWNGVASPNLQGKSLIGLGTFTESSGSYSYGLGDTGGKVKHKLTSDESGLREHFHNSADVSFTAPEEVQATNASGVDFRHVNQVSSGVKSVDGVNLRDGAQDALDYHENRSPYLTVGYILRIK